MPSTSSFRCCCQFTIASLLFVVSSVWPVMMASAQGEAQDLLEGFRNPPIDCRPHTRWWWMGSAVTKEEITWELEEMFKKGIGGVEQISMQPVYEKGNLAYLSNEYLEMVKHTVQDAKRLGMNVSFNFGGPGWIIGGDWVPEEERSKCLVPTWIDLEGPQTYSGSLPKKLQSIGESHWDVPTSDITEQDPLLAVMAGQIVEEKIDPASFVFLTANLVRHDVIWEVPPGKWRLMAFWLKRTGHGNTVDHFSKSAMKRYCGHLGGKFKEAIGEEFGKTVDSFFCDSFEVAFAPGGIYWSDNLIEEFEKRQGYDLMPYLPAIWWDIGDLTPKVRYDVNEFLHRIGLEAFFGTFLDWCKSHGIEGRIQPYGFSTDIIEGAGRTHIPEMEVTAGEKDAVPWFDTRIGPKKLVSSGAHLYGRDIVTTEAYTYLHWEPYRATLEELKIATDVFFRTGANKIYNHGYSYSPERDVAPGRGFYAAIRISHPNTWWEYYPHLSEYIARCCYLLRQGRFTADVAVYSPLANQWTKHTLNARRWNRDFDWGELGNLLVANGYDFDLVNDDVLQNHAKVIDGMIRIRENAYKFLILPNIEAIPLETFQFIEGYVRRGGIVIALERVPESSVGMVNHEETDEEVKAISKRLFRQPRGRNGTGLHDYDGGRTYQIKRVLDRSDVLYRRSSALDPFLKTLREHLAPDFGIDFVREGLRENGGLTFVHRKTNSSDLYFVTNIQDRPSEVPVTFRVNDAVPWEWNPYDGSRSRIYQYRVGGSGIEIPLLLAPYESTFVVFEPGTDPSHVEQSGFEEIASVTGRQIEAFAQKNGTHRIITKDGDSVTRLVNGVPAPAAIEGDWTLTLEGRGFPRLEKKLDRHESWTLDPETKHFSGTGRYEVQFELPSEYFAEGLLLDLDLGSVGNVAEVFLNDVNIGTCWMRGQRLDATAALRKGTNMLVVLVTNTLINRVSAFQVSPPVPEELVPHYGRALGPPDTGLSEVRGFEPLPASGLMGPVRILARKRIMVSLDDFR